MYGAVINTTDGTTYGLCHQENIWKGYELAWSTGYTTESNGCHLNSEHFESMIGKTIDSVTYYASNGIYTLDIEDVKVLAKTGEQKLLMQTARLQQEHWRQVPIH